MFWCFEVLVFLGVFEPNTKKSDKCIGELDGLDLTCLLKGIPKHPEMNLKMTSFGSVKNPVLNLTPVRFGHLFASKHFESGLLSNWSHRMLTLPNLQAENPKGTTTTKSLGCWMGFQITIIIMSFHLTSIRLGGLAWHEAMNLANVWLLTDWPFFLVSSCRKHPSF